MEPRLNSLSVRGFRALRDFSVEGLGRVNLITGRNNTGKSSVLEALRILASDAAPAILFGILSHREEDLGESEGGGRFGEKESPLQIGSLFSGFPLLGEAPEPIQIGAVSFGRKLSLRLKVDWFPRERDGKQSRLPLEGSTRIFQLEDEAIPVLVIESSAEMRTIPLDDLRYHPSFGSRLLQRPKLGGEPRIECVYVSPYGGERTANLGFLWDSIALSDSEKDVVEALRIIDPEITAVSMVGGESPRRPRTAIVRSLGLSRPIPLRSFGDGLNRLFGIVLSLVNAKNGLLLIDEFENGMHHAVQLDVWKAIFGLAKKLDVQVFATSHSWDAIEAFQEASAETPEEGLLIRLTRRRDRIIPTLFRENELAVATREGIEVR